MDDFDLSPAGDLLVSCGFDGTVRLWELETGKELAVLDDLGSALTHAPGRARADTYHTVRFSPDGSLVAAITANRLKIWEVETRRAVAVIEATESEFSWCKTMSFSPDGMRLATGHLDGKVRFWDPHARSRGSSALAGELGTFRIGARGIVPIESRALYGPVEIPMGAIPPQLHLAVLRRAGDEVPPWSELFARYLEAKNIPSALLVLSRIPAESSQEERQLMGAAYLRAAKRELQREDADFEKALSLLAEAENFAADDPAGPPH